MILKNLKGLKENIRGLFYKAFGVTSELSEDLNTNKSINMYKDGKGKI